MATEKVEAQAVLAGAEGAGGSELSGPQKAALNLAHWTLGLIALCSLIIVVVVLIQIPSTPSEPRALSAESLDLYAKQVNTHITIRNACIEGGVKIFQTVIVVALLPVLMTTIGYIFGRGER